MSEKVHPSFSRRARSREITAAIAYGAATDGWIVPGDERLVEDSEGDLATGPLNAFDESHTDSSLDAEVDTGEALVEGAYLATDETHTVTLAASTANQTVYLGWKDGQPDTILIGLDSAFEDTDHQLPIWEFDTDASGVIDARDRRRQLAHREEMSDVHGVGGDYVARTSRADQWPDWGDLRNVPAVFEPEVHGHGKHDGTVPELDDNGEILSSQIPDIGITETYTVADEAERLALDVQLGDIAIQQDNSQTYIFTGGDASVDGNWSAFVSPAAPVDTVFGRTGDVTAESGDYSVSQVTGAASESYVDAADSTLANDIQDVLDNLTAHENATSVHGSNGDVAGMDDLFTADNARSAVGGATLPGRTTFSDGVRAPNASGSNDGFYVGSDDDNHLSVNSNRVTQYSGESDGWGWRTGQSQGGYEWAMTLDHGGGLRPYGPVYENENDRLAARQWVSSNFNNYTFSEDYNDLSNRSHTNEDHDTDYLPASEYTPEADTSGIDEEAAFVIGLVEGGRI